jgi:dTDP-4-dehydrorhamnose reductase
MKLLVVGASGLIGGNLLRAARENGHEALGTYAACPDPGLAHLELGDQAAAERILDEYQPDVVVCCAAWSWVDGCETSPERAFRDNVDLPVRLAKLASAREVRFVHFSSSYVFDGTSGPYDENAAPHPLSVYGRTKLESERQILEATGGTALIARTMGVYGEEFRRKNFVYQVVDRLRAGKEMVVPSDQYGNATHATDLAAMILLLLEKRIAGGVWNVAGPEPALARKDFALRIAREYALDEGLLRFVSTEELGQSALRPQQGGLRIERTVAATGYRPKAWQPVPL